MRAAVTLLVVILSSGCATEPPVELPAFVGIAANACLPEAILMTESLHKQGIQARIIVIDTPSFSHAAVAYLYPAAAPQLWVWDSTSRSIRIDADFENATLIAKAWLKANLNSETAVHARFM